MAGTFRWDILKIFKPRVTYMYLLRYVHDWMNNWGDRLGVKSCFQWKTAFHGFHLGIMLTLALTLDFATIIIWIYDYIQGQTIIPKSKIAELKRRMDAKMKEICPFVFTTRFWREKCKSIGFGITRPITLQQQRHQYSNGVRMERKPRMNWLLMAHS